MTHLYPQNDWQASAFRVNYQYSVGSNASFSLMISPGAGAAWLGSVLSVAWNVIICMGKESVDQPTSSAIKPWCKIEIGLNGKIFVYCWSYCFHFICRSTIMQLHSYSQLNFLLHCNPTLTLTHTIMEIQSFLRLSSHVDSMIPTDPQKLCAWGSQWLPNDGVPISWVITN